VCSSDLFEEHGALAATHAAIRGGGIQPPAIAAVRALGNDVHPITSMSGRLEHGSMAFVSAQLRAKP
jgi:hypothetical protein